MAGTSQPSLPFDVIPRSASLSDERLSNESVMPRSANLSGEPPTDSPDARLKASRSEVVEPPRSDAAEPARYDFVRHPRARRYLIRVTDEQTVRVTIPRGGSRREAEAFAAREQAWIEKQRRRAQAEREARAERERRERERRTTNGERYANDERRSDVDEQRTLLVRAKRELPPRLLELAARHGLAVSRVSIRNQRRRWGSCSRSGHICLNWRLVTMPEEVRDYVLIHELMHLRRMDHSPKFWRLVAEACPAYKKARAWLRSHARVEELGSRN